MKRIIRLFGAVLLTVGLLVQTGCGGKSVSKTPFAKIGEESIELKGEFADSIKSFYDNGCYVLDVLSGIGYAEDGSGINNKLYFNNVDQTKPIMCVDIPEYWRNTNLTDCVYTSYNFIHKYFENVDVSIVNDIKLGDDAKTASDKFDGKGVYNEKVGFAVFIADGKIVDMDKYIKMANEYLETTFPNSQVNYFTGRDDITAEESKAYTGYGGTYGILSNPLSQISSLQVMTDAKLGVTEENSEYLSMLYSALFASMDLSKMYGDGKISNLYSVEVSVDGDIICHVATHAQYVKDWIGDSED